MTSLELRKELNLTVKQFEKKLSLLGIVSKENYSDQEVILLKDFQNKNLSKSELREIPYTNKGWITLRNLYKDFGCSKNTFLSYLKKLNIQIYKPIHNLSFINTEDFYKLKLFFEENPNTIERKTQLCKQTSLEKYGVKNPAQTENSRKKISEKNKSNTESRLSKAKETNLKRYGIENPLLLWDSSLYWENISKEKREEINKKISCSKLKKFENKDKYYLCHLEKIFKKDRTGIARNIEKLDIIKKEGKYPYIDKKDLYKLSNYYSITEFAGTSFLEKELIGFIKSIYKGEVQTNNRNIIFPKELDIYIPEKRIAIEFNGLYWHDENHISNNSHFEKTQSCNKIGIDLIHIFEDDWILKKEIVKSVIASRIGIYQQKFMARKLKIQYLEKNKAKEFFDKNHLQGFAKADYYVALVDQDGDVKQCGAFNMKGFHDGNVELTRFASKLNNQIIGGFGKIIADFIKLKNINSITSYVNKSFFNGKGYLAVGFEIAGKIKPSYSYIYKGKRWHKSFFRKNKIKKMYSEGKLFYFNEKESEHTNMKKNNIYRIYDSGNLKVIFKKQY